MVFCSFPFIKYSNSFYVKLLGLNKIYIDHFCIAERDLYYIETQTIYIYIYIYICIYIYIYTDLAITRIKIYMTERGSVSMLYHSDQINESSSG